MFGFVMQNWVTIRGANNQASIIQQEESWLTLSSFQDIVFWLDVREVTNPVGGGINVIDGDLADQGRRLVSDMCLNHWGRGACGGRPTALKGNLERL